MRFKLTPRFMLFTVLCVCLTGEELWLKNAPASYTGRIVFTSFRDGNAEIYVMDAHGRNQERLTNHRAYDGYPDWSPDGTKIAFVSNRDGARFQIYVMDIHGKNPIRLTDGPGEKRHPDWSPDGGKIAFSVHNRFDVDHIAVMDADGNREKLETVARYPSWSPDGKQIAFAHGEIYVIGVDGQGRKRVTHDLGHKLNPSFSPNGRRIAYEGHPHHEEFHHIFVVGADGRNRVRLTHHEEHHSGPAWSPDGQAIAYSVLDGIRHVNFRGTIHLMASDGRYIRQLSDDGNARDFEPDISPLGLAVSPNSVTTTIWGRLKKVELKRR